MATFVKGPRGGLMKVVKQGKKEIYRRATQSDIANMSTAQKIKFGTRAKAGKKI